MRFLKRAQELAPPVSEALGLRLQAVANRGKIEGATYAAPEERPALQAQQKVFWTPHEVSDSSDA